VAEQSRRRLNWEIGMTSVVVVSDFVCPWCYVGKRNLDALRGEFEIVTYWHPYLLHPEVPAGGIDRAELVRAKFGSEARARELGRRVEDVAKAAGLFLDLSTVKRIPDTRDAHRVMRWATGQGVADRLAELLFAAHFADGRDIGDHDTLADLAAQSGLDNSLVRELLASDADREAVQVQADHARTSGVTGVPTMILNQQLAVVGAQPIEALRGAMVQAAGPEAD